MRLIDTQIEGLKIIDPTAFGDHRGYFMETYNREDFNQVGLTIDFCQDNQSLSSQEGTIRGLHYQMNPKAQLKLVRCLKGAIYDVAVDIRKNSPTYGKWVGVILSEFNKRQLLVPKGFAHGFCTLVPDVIVAYKVDEFYSKENERGILWNDPALNIDWPTGNPVLSDKDEKSPLLKDADNNFVWGDLI